MNVKIVGPDLYSLSWACAVRSSAPPKSLKGKKRLKADKAIADTLSSLPYLAVLEYADGDELAKAVEEAKSLLGNERVRATTITANPQMEEDLYSIPSTAVCMEDCTNKKLARYFGLEWEGNVFMESGSFYVYDDEPALAAVNGRPPFYWNFPDSVVKIVKNKMAAWPYFLINRR